MCSYLAHPRLLLISSSDTRWRMVVGCCSTLWRHVIRRTCLRQDEKRGVIRFGPLFFFTMFSNSRLTSRGMFSTTRILRLFGSMCLRTRERCAGLGNPSTNFFCFQGNPTRGDTSALRVFVLPGAGGTVTRRGADRITCIVLLCMVLSVKRRHVTQQPQPQPPHKHRS